MDIQLTAQAIQHIEGDALVIGAVRTGSKSNAKNLQFTKNTGKVDELLDGLVSERHKDGEFKADLGELLTIHPLGHLAVKRVIVVGLGAEEKISTQSIRRASAIAARHLQHTGAREITLALQWG